MRTFVRLSIITISLVLAQATPGVCAMESPYPEHCRAIRFSFVEFIAPQGFLGLGTPQPSARLVRDALIEEYRSRAWMDEALRRQETGETNETNSGLVREKSYLNEVCYLAKDAGIKELVFACHADTESSSSRMSSGSRARGDSWGAFFTMCVMTRPMPKDADWKQFRESALALPGSYVELVDDDAEESRYERIDDPLRRRGAHRESLREALYSYMREHSRQRSIWAEPEFFSKKTIPTPATSVDCSRSWQEQKAEALLWLESCATPIWSSGDLLHAGKGLIPIFHVPR